ncbi:ATP-binding protein [uncultured Streptomyces sp.]|uniref:ATP-binding protein n=1 Tax=uncultured Streptomyces sp. TaxID=174707 RepID=UPI00263913CD|nr:ATP-binding protein [uncultured Streptomyces sp.]
MNETTQLRRTHEAFFRRERRSIPLVRMFVRAALPDWACPALMDEGLRHDVLLCVSELATNALVHGVPPGRGFRIHLIRAGDVLRIEVHDSGDGRVERVADAGPDAEGGRGLRVVAELADAWGVGERNPGKSVWCEFAVPAIKFVESAPQAHSLR